MASSNSPFDVFVAYDHPDLEQAQRVAKVLESYGLTVFLDPQASAAEPSAEATVWDAMAESQALVLVVPEMAPSSRMVFELGAARAWNKTVYAVAASPTMSRIPAALRDIPTLPISRLDEIAQAIRNCEEPISEEDQRRLQSLYKRLNIPIDQLTDQPSDLARLVKDFNKQSGKLLSAEQVMRLLLRMRKRPMLPRISQAAPRSMA